MRSLLSALAIAALLAAPATAEDADKPDSISLADGKISLPVPTVWERKKPRTRIVEHEFAAKGPKGAKPARVTIMGAGGGVEANIDRWEGQFRTAEGGAVKAKVEKAKVGESDVHIVDITGTYMDRPGGPFAGGKVVPRPGHRMLGAIIVTPKSGHYFVKVLGDEKTVAANLKPLKTMLGELEVK